MMDHLDSACGSPLAVLPVSASGPDPFSTASRDVLENDAIFVGARDVWVQTCRFSGRPGRNAVNRGPIGFHSIGYSVAPDSPAFGYFGASDSPAFVRNSDEDRS
jgi:hypothetical protein